MKDEPHTCLCGHRFEGKEVTGIRSVDEGFLNKDVAHHSLSGPFEIQCPKCLLWIRDLTDDIEV